MLLEWSMQVKSSLTASDFNSLYGDVMQALPDSSRYMSILVVLSMVSGFSPEVTMGARL